MKSSQRILLNMTGIFTIASVLSPYPVYAYDSQALFIERFQQFTLEPNFFNQNVRTLIVKILTNQDRRLLKELRNTDKNLSSNIVGLKARSSIRIQVSYTGETTILLSVQPKRAINQVQLAPRAISPESLIMSIAIVLVMLAAILLVLLGLMLALVVVLIPSKQSILL